MFAIPLAVAAALPLPLAAVAAADRPAEELGGEPELGESVTVVASAEPARSLPDFERGGRAV